MSLAEIADAVDGNLRSVSDPGTVVTGIGTDSRSVSPGALFFALRGDHNDGHRHVRDALAAGFCAAVVSDESAGPVVVVDDTLAALGRLAQATLRALPDVRTVGVTGSNGKTTTKDLIATLLGRLGPTVAAPASYNGEIGLPVSVLQATPETRFLVLEYGARGIGHIRSLTQIARPEIAVVLGVGVAHVGEFGSREAIATAKGELVEALGPDGVAILNIDDNLVGEMRSRTTARVMTFGRNDKADVTASDISVDEHGCASFTLNHGRVCAPVQLAIYGEHQVTNALAAATVALECGLSLPDTAESLSAATPRSRWRMEVGETPAGLTLINDAYNANPDSMAAGLRALIAIANGRPTWAVLGEMAELGEVSLDAHRSIGRLVRDLGINDLVVVGTVAQAIGDSAGGGSTRVHLVDNADAAAEFVQAHARLDDVVLVKASRSVGLERVAQLLLAAKAVPA